MSFGRVIRATLSYVLGGMLLTYVFGLFTALILNSEFVGRGVVRTVLILLAGLQTIPEELYEAASVDGASPVQKFFHITLPGLRYITTVLILLLTIWHFGNFVIILVVSLVFALIYYRVFVRRISLE
jgi:ABC-type sugar transport system permease subunit